MTANRRPAPRRAAPPERGRTGPARALDWPSDGALVRLRVDADRWAEAVPPVPSGHRVTVSFTSDVDAAHHGPALELLGYEVLSGRDVAQPGRRADPTNQADFLVTQDLLEAHPAWWREVAGQAERAYSLAHGPAVLLLAAVLERHLRHLRAAPAG